jgi:transposase-like protein
MTKQVTIRRARVFSEEFRKARVKEYETGQFSVQEMVKLFSISHVVLYRWIYRYSTYNKRGIKIVEMADSSKQRVKDMQKRIAELERIVGQKQLNIDFLEKMIELAKEEYGIDVKKNSDTPPSTGSGPTSKP